MPQVTVLAVPWPRIISAARKGPADVAVAYVGQGAARLLPLRRGSRLVVDASEAAVRSGQTDPKELLKYLRRGVDVFSRPRLHAKVFAFGSVAFIGSTNVSHRSLEVLAEAAVELRGRQSVAQARRLVRDLATGPVGEEFLKKLARIYRPPRVLGGKRRKAGRGIEPREAADGQSLWLVQLVTGNWSEEEYEAERAGKAVARRRLRRGFHLDSFSYTRRARWPIDDQVMMVTSYGPRDVRVAPPGRVLRVEKVSGKKSHIVVLELPPKYKRKLAVLRRRLPRATARRLKFGGLVAPGHAEAIRKLWL